MLGLGRRVVACLNPNIVRVSRAVSTSQPPRDLRAFLDAENPDDATFGRAWRAAELRLKSWEDLHKLWYVCLKERNMLLTHLHWTRGEPEQQTYRYRYGQVKLSMNRIKQVLSERAHQEANPVKSADMRKIIHLM